MNYSVPNFEMDDDYPNIPITSGITTPSKKSTVVDEDIMELIWQNGQVIAQTQNQRSQTVAASAPPLFLQEDEMATWLQYPLDDSSFERDLYADFLYTTPSSSVVTAAVPPPGEIDTTTAEIRSNPPPSQLRCTEGEFSQRLQNFGHFSRLPKAKSQNFTSSSGNTARASTIVYSNESPIVEVSRVSDNVAPVSAGNGGGRTTTDTTTAAAETSSGREMSTTACEFTGTSSASGSRGSVSASAEPPPLPPLQESALTPAEDRKRKGRESDNEEHSEDAEFESADAKKQTSSSTSAKRSRAAEVHNLSERRRRDRINEKMKALQELIPRCNKSDKASMLDEAIEYLKSLQMQVQMMSMGCGMVPMMYPGIPQYMPTMGMGMRMGMGTGMGMNRPMVPYPSLMPGPAMQNAAAAVAQMTPRFPVPAYHLPPVPVPDPSRIRAVNQPDHPMMNSLVGHNTNQPRLPSLSDPNQQYYALHQAQVLPQNQQLEQPSSSNPAAAKKKVQQIIKPVDY